MTTALVFKITMNSKYVWKIWKPGAEPIKLKLEKMAFVGTAHKHTSKVFKCPECDIDPGKDVLICVECRPGHIKSWHPPGMPDLSVTHGLEVFLR